MNETQFLPTRQTGKHHADRNPCDVRFDVSAAIIAGYGPRKRSPTASAGGK